MPEAPQPVPEEREAPNLDVGAVQLHNARGVLAAFLAAGLTHVISSPGSRSTPLLLAAFAEGVPLHTVVDERCAAFFGLGVGRGGGLACLLCTSGTALAHYLPALIEAREARIPLLVVSADRPLDRLDCGAPQTIDQATVLGGGVLRTYDLGSFAVRGRAQRALLRRAAEGVQQALAHSGPVHFNARFRKPLEPPAEEKDLWNSLHRTEEEASAEPAAGAGEAADSDAVGSSSAAVCGHTARHPIAWHRATLAEPDPRGVAALAEDLRSSLRPLVVLGPGPLRSRSSSALVGRFAAHYGLPLCADLASNLRRTAGTRAAHEGPDPWCDALLEALASPRFVARMQPDLVLQLGAPPVATAWEQAIVSWTQSDSFERGGARARHVVVAPRRLDPVNTADRYLEADPLAVVEALLAREGELGTAGSRSDRRAWLMRLQALDRRIAATVEEEATQWSDGAALRTVFGSLAGTPSGREGTADGAREILAWLGNSLPIRLANTFVARQLAAVSFASQRGVNGIDGNLSSFAGMALRRRPAIAVAVLGDVSLVHDLSGLELVRQVSEEQRIPIVGVVLHNGGGRIFEQLPVANRGLGDHQWRHWSTPSPQTFSGAARHFGLHFVRVGQQGELHAAVQRAAGAQGASLVEVSLPAQAAAQQAVRLRRRVDDEVAAWLTEPQ